jgi:hypothetical protein
MSSTQETSTTEHKALIGFAARLGTSVSHEDGIANEMDLRSEAQLLMNLLSSNPEPAAVIKESLDAVRPYFTAEPSTEMLPESSTFNHSTGAAIDDIDIAAATAAASASAAAAAAAIDTTNTNNNTSNTSTNSGAFSFSCPSLSLDGKSPPPLRSRLPSDSSDDSMPSLVAPPAPTPIPIVSMGRPLVVDDRDALRLSADSMARNILRTFQKAVKWRKQCWIDTLARPLVDEERKMKAAGATQEELKELLETPVARVIASLNQASIEVLDARTSFRVLPQRWDRHNNNKTIDDDEDDAEVQHPSKKRKIASDNDEITKESSTTTTTAHVLSFQTVLNLSSPAGYLQVTLDAPGVMEGKFTTINGDTTVLTGVSVQVDTRVLAAMIEKSSRIIARASAEEFMNPYPEFTDEEGASLMMSPNPTVTTAPRRLSASDSESGEAAEPTIITPRNTNSQSAYCDTELDLLEQQKPCIPLPDDLSGANHKRAILRMVSPQPPGSSNSSVEDSNPSTNPPSTAKRSALVSPPLSFNTEYLSFDVKTGGPSLPALVEVACAEMRTN